MAQLKAHEVQRYVANPQDAHRVFLVYGPDSGMVSEHAATLARSSKIDLADPFSTIKIHANDAAADPQRIADEAFTVSMFGGKRLIWISGTTSRNLATTLQPVLDDPPDDALVLVEAGDIKKSSPLRSRIEKSPAAMALPCYPDQQRSVGDLVDAHLAAADLRIDAEARNLLLSLLGADRLASRAELDKLVLYASGNESISVDDVAAVVGDASGLDVDTAVDAASVGNISEMDATLKRLFARGTSSYAIVSAALRHFQMLDLAKTQMQSSGQSASAVISAVKPPINFRRKDFAVRALSSLSQKTLKRSLQRLNEVSLDSRSKASLDAPLISMAFLAIALDAARSAKR